MKRPFPTLELDPSVVTVEGARHDAQMALQALGIAAENAADSSVVLPPEQVEELESISLGITRRQRSDDTGLTFGQVTTLRKHTYEKLGASNGPQATRIGIVAGIIPIESGGRFMPKLDSQTRTVIALMSLGLSEQAIAQTFSLEPDLVKDEIAEAKKDLGAESSPHLVRRAFEAKALKDPAKQHYFAVRLREELGNSDVEFSPIAAGALTRAIVLQRPFPV